MRIETWENGVLLDTQEPTDLAAYQAYKIGILQMDCERAILDVVPEFKQRNAAMGILDTDEANDIKTHISACTGYYNTLKAQVLACTDIASVDAIFWDTIPEDPTLIQKIINFFKGNG